MDRARHEYIRKLMPELTWEEAAQRWSNLSLEIQATLMNFSDQEQRSASHIYDTLLQKLGNNTDISSRDLQKLETIHTSSKVKHAFSEALKECASKFN